MTHEKPEPTEEPEAADPTGGPEFPDAPEPPRVARLRAVGGVIVLLLVILAVGGLIGWFLWSRSASVPDLAGMTRDDARRVLDERGLELGFVSESYTGEEGQYELGAVVAQSPPTGSRSAPGKPIAVTVVAGPAWVSMPEVVGLSLQEAGEKLEERQLGVDLLDPVLHVIENEDYKGDRGVTVSSSTVPPGGRLERDSRVLLTIARPIGASERRWIFAHPIDADLAGKESCYPKCHSENDCSRCHLELLGGQVLPRGVTAADLVRDTVLAVAGVVDDANRPRQVAAEERSGGLVEVAVSANRSPTERRSKALVATAEILKATLGRGGIRSVAVEWVDPVTGRSLMVARMSYETYWERKWSGLRGADVPAASDSYRESF